MDLQWLSYLNKTQSTIEKVSVKEEITIPGEVIFEPINYFSGTFEGNGHTIDNFKLQSTSDVLGLFLILENGIVDNLIINETLSTVSGTVGGLAYETKGHVHITKVTMNGSMTASGATYGIGAFVGYAYNNGSHLYVADCTNNMTISAPNGYNAGAVAGTAGNNQTFTLGVYNFENTGNVSCSQSSDGYIIGYIYGPQPENQATNPTIDLISVKNSGSPNNRPVGYNSGRYNKHYQYEDPDNYTAYYHSGPDIYDIYPDAVVAYDSDDKEIGRYGTVASALEDDDVIQVKLISDLTEQTVTVNGTTVGETTTRKVVEFAEGRDAEDNLYTLTGNINVGATGDLTISGGRYTTEFNEQTVAAGGSLTITGGTFTHDPTAFVNTDDYAVTNDATAGTWTVTKKNPVAKIGND